MLSVIFLETSRWSCWFIGKFAKGALSNETEYKKELDGYMSSHNVIFGMKRGNDFDVSEMQDIVKSHMQYCQRATADNGHEDILSPQKI
jgi:hypothetical protein